MMEPGPNELDRISLMFPPLRELGTMEVCLTDDVP